MNLKTIVILLFITNILIGQKKQVKEKTSYGGIRIGYLDGAGLKTGKWETFGNKRNLVKEENFKEGKKNGVEKEFFSNGQTHVVRNYKDDLYDGVMFGYFDNGVLESKGEYKKNQRVGKHERYYPNGVLLSIEKLDDKGRKVSLRSYYQNGQTLEVCDIDKKGNGVEQKFNGKGVVIESNIYENHHGVLQKRFYDTGIIKDEEIYVYVNDNSVKWVQKKYTESGRLAEERQLLPHDDEYKKVYKDSVNEHFKYVKGKVEGYFESHYLNGKIAEQGYYKKGFKNGLWKSFYDDGTLKFTGKYISDNPQLKDSTHTYFYPNGKIKKIEYYKVTESKVVRSVWHDHRIGTWKKYYENGNIEESADYGDEEQRNQKNGKYLSYYENGNIETDALYNGGQLFGVYKSFYRNGNLKEYVSNHSIGRKNGVVKTYYENGVLESEIIYDTGQKNGKAKEYFENGKMKSSGFYEYDNNEFGTWIYNYALSGKVAEKITFSEDRKKIEYFYESGKRMAEITVEYENPLGKDEKFFNNEGKEVSMHKFASLSSIDKVKDYTFFYSDLTGEIDVYVHYEQLNEIKETKLTFK
jgi:antitoxin component YwqK of YwqJK toxin-antitoxin module